ncbi:LOW QUALITY PROTEIN: IQ domain-containing protein E [Gastrophryne carolinensis]
MSWLSNENGTEVEELEDAFHDDGVSATTYESDTDKKVKKKKVGKPPRSQSSPYLASARLPPKKAPVWRSLKGTGQMHTEDPTVKVPRQLWLATLKQGHSLTQPQSDTDIGQAWVSPGSSTPEYLKEALGMKKPKYSRSSSNGNKKKKKMTNAQKSDNDIIKTKLRRLEEENNRKDRQIEQLLDPTRSSEFTRSLVDKKSDNSLLINTLKQKILKLEKQCKEKDGALSKLQTDLKTTNQEEMRIAMETYYEEIQRLQLLVAKAEAREKKPPPENKDSLAREKAVKMALMKLSKQVKELQEENKSLKADLDRAMAQSPNSSRSKGYSEWSKQRLVRKISELEKKLEMAEKSKPSAKEEDKSAQPAAVADTDHVTGPKPDLQEECERLRNIIKKVKEDRSALQERLAARESSFKKLQQENTDLERQLQRLKERKDEREEINRLSQKIKRLEAELEDEKTEKEAALEAMKKAQNDSRQSRPNSAKNTPHETSVRGPIGFTGAKENQKRQEAAQVIQKNWRQYKSKKEDNSDLEEATVFLQAALRGHLARQKNLSSPASSPHAKSPRANQLSQQGHTKSLEDPSKDEEDPVTLLQSTFRAHLTRTKMLGQGTRYMFNLNSNTQSGDMTSSPGGSLYKAALTLLYASESSEEVSEESIEEVTSEEDDGPLKRPASRSSLSKPPSGKTQQPITEEQSDDSDDIIVSPSRPTRRKDWDF